jgi:hypothetical protein
LLGDVTVSGFGLQTLQSKEALHIEAPLNKKHRVGVSYTDAV